jgi:hypothetical protein
MVILNDPLSYEVTGFIAKYGHNPGSRVFADLRSVHLRVTIHT